MKKVLSLVALSVLAGCGGSEGGSAPPPPAPKYTFNFIQQYSVGQSEVKPECAVFGLDTTQTVPEQHVIAARELDLIEGLSVLALDSSGELIRSYKVPKGGELSIDQSDIPQNGYVAFVESILSYVSGKGDVFVQVIHKDFIQDAYFNVVKEQSVESECYKDTSALTREVNRLVNMSAVDLGEVPDKYIATTITDSSISNISTDIAITTPENRAVLGKGTKDGQLLGYVFIPFSELTDPDSATSNIARLRRDVNDVPWQIVDTSVFTDAEINVKYANHFYNWQLMDKVSGVYAYPSTNDSGISSSHWYVWANGTTLNNWTVEQNEKIDSPSLGYDLTFALQQEPLDRQPTVNRNCSQSVTNTCVDLNGAMGATPTEQGYNIQRSFVKAKLGQSDVWMSVYAPPTDNQIIPSTGDAEFDKAFSLGTIERQDVTLAQYDRNKIYHFMASFSDPESVTNNDHTQTYTDSKYLIRLPSDVINDENDLLSTERTVVRR
uniref:hypothetical protein n=1 Tax=Thaumasiovibrio occultus TaxID=1891184 RepID=UPI000B35DF2B|nr:hypothetical protein [Thaumasiovibrio occultus]